MATIVPIVDADTTYRFRGWDNRSYHDYVATIVPIVDSDTTYRFRGWDNRSYHVATHSKRKLRPTHPTVLSNALVIAWQQSLNSHGGRCYDSFSKRREDWMLGHGWPCPAARIGGLLLVAMSAIVHAQPRSWPASMLDDADLHDVFFLDANEGWSVGDRGVIWHTSDGGSNWQLQSSEVRDSLRSVRFVDVNRGWVVGGSTEPYSHRGLGVVLRTENGGKTWFKERDAQLPLLRRVRFVDSQIGFTLGDGSPLFPSGIFSTLDAGRTWNPVAVRGNRGWVAGDVVGEQGLALSPFGQVMLFDAQRGLPTKTPQVPTPSMHDVAWLDEVTAFAVGDSGTLWHSTDAGRTWYDISDRLPAGQVRDGDLRTVSCRGSAVWITLDGGAKLIFSGDGGARWEVLTTDSELPVSRLFFLNESIGWSVGPLGTIRVTTDRGRTWRDQRGRERRLAVLAVFPRVSDIPWTAVAHVGASLGGRIRVIVLDDDSPITFSVPAQERLSHAVVAAGGHGAVVWKEFALGSTETRVAASRLVDSWQKMHERKRYRSTGGGRLASKIAAAVEFWNPAILLTSSGASRNSIDYLLAHSIAQIASESQIRALGVIDNEEALPSDLKISPTKFVVGLGTSLDELAFQARSFTERRPTTESMVTLRAIDSRGSTPRGNLLNGSGLTPAGSARRASLPSTTGDWKSLQRQVQLRSNLQALIRRAAESPATASAWQAQMEAMMADLDRSSAARILYEAAQRHFERGNYQAALESIDSLTRDYPDESIAGVALRDAIVCLCSREIRHVVNRRPRQPETTSTQDEAIIVANQRPASQHKQPEKGKGPIRNARSIPVRSLVQTGPTIGSRLAKSQKSIVTHSGDRRERSDLWKLATWTRRLNPVVKAEPVIAFGLEAHRREHLNPGIRQKGVYSRLARTALSGSWRACAATELAVIQPERNIVKPIHECTNGPRPYLDARLDDEIWKVAAPLVLKTNSTSQGFSPQSSSLVQIAHDSEFLYLAVQCGLEPSVDYPDESGKRIRDAELRGHDRIEFSFDVNRDYGTAWQLQFDHRGWTQDRLGANRHWDPQWYVAAGRGNLKETGEPCWTVEVAIPLAELARLPLDVATMWTFSVRRIVPSVGEQSWPVGVRSLEDAGLLAF